MEFVTVSPTFERLVISMESNSTTDYYRSLPSFGVLNWTCLLKFLGKISVLSFFNRPVDSNTVAKLSY